MAEDLPSFGQLYQAEEDNRIPVVAKLATTWHYVSSLVPKPQHNCNAAQHNTLQCLIKVAISTAKLEDEAEYAGGNKRVGLPTPSSHPQVFAVLW